MFVDIFMYAFSITDAQIVLCLVQHTWSFPITCCHIFVIS